MSNLVPTGFAFLHSTLFLGGKNHSDKLDSYRYPELKMVYDRAEKELIVTYRGKVAIVPSTNVAYYHPGPAEERQPLSASHPMVANASHTAQVETPFGHVHAGPGKGKKR